MKPYKYIIFALVTMLAIVVQLVNPILAYADEEVPPTQPAEAATESAPTDIPIATEVPTQPEALWTEATPTELPAATEVPASDSPTVDSVATDIPAADTAPAEEPTLLEIMEQIPAQTDIVVLDTTGELIPLATQEAAEIIAEGDPMWCPVGATTVTVNCVNAATVSALLPLLASKNEDGIIYFYTPTAYNTNDVTFDGTNLNIDQLADNALTIQGGWNGNPALGSMITFSGNSVFSVPVQITNWTGAVTVNNITVNGAAGNGLMVNTAGNININNVTATNAVGYGAYLDNTVSVSASTVTVGGTNTFSGNYNTGLYVLSDGNISANNITANNSTIGMGANIHNTTSSSNATVTLNGTNMFSGNYNNGLTVISYGNVSAANVTASSNWGGRGVYIDNTFSSSNATVTFTGTNIFNGNGGTGFFVYSNGNISANNVTASDSVRGLGATIDNTTSSSNAAVTLTGTNIFSGNYSSGLSVASTGNVSANNVTANNSDTGFGAYIHNASSSSNAIVALTGDNTFSGNTSTGLYVYSNGNISANNVTASGNLNGYGVSINNTISSSNATVTLTGTNLFSGNYNNGLYVLSDGNVSANNITASNSTVGYGTYINNTTSSSNTTVMLTGANLFSTNYNTGLYVVSDGNILLNNITANGNGGSYDCTSDDDWSDCRSGVVLENYTGTGDVTLTGKNVFSNNKQGWGLYVDTNGAISLENATANNNGLDGVNLYGWQKNVTLTGTNVFNSNGYEGLYIGTWGDVFVENINASLNGDTGALLFSGGNATLLGKNYFTDNDYEGLYLISRGNISLSNLIVTGNGFNGTYAASGGYFSTPLNVSINASIFSNNAEYGVNGYNICGTLNFDNSTLTAFSSNAFGDYLNPSGTDYTYYDYKTKSKKTIQCKGDVRIDGISIILNTTTLNSVLEAKGGNEIEFDLSCEKRDRFPVTLTNGDKIEIICPVSGTARIKRLDNTMLPAELPAGYTYSSAFSLEILKNNKPINYINEGGSVNVSFEVPYMEEGIAYSVLYLDNGIWVPLKEFMFDGNGSPRGFNLHADDPRRILSGSNFIFDDGSPTRLEISTNFPGIFVLAQH